LIFLLRFAQELDTRSPIVPTKPQAICGCVQRRTPTWLYAQFGNLRARQHVFHADTA
jgi:hypothetical protein